MPPTQEAPKSPVRIQHVGKRVWMIVGAIVLLIVIVAGGAYAWYHFHKPVTATPVTTPQNIQILHEKELQAMPQNTDTKNVTTQERVNILKSLSPAPAAPKT